MRGSTGWSQRGEIATGVIDIADAAAIGQCVTGHPPGGVVIEAVVPIQGVGQGVQIALGVVTQGVTARFGPCTLDQAGDEEQAPQQPPKPCVITAYPE